MVASTTETKPVQQSSEEECSAIPITTNLPNSGESEPKLEPMGRYSVGGTTSGKTTIKMILDHGFCMFLIN